MATDGLEAQEALRAALAALGFSVITQEQGPQRSDLVLSAPNGAVVRVEVKVVARVDPASIQRFGQSASQYQSEVVVVVADRISTAARAALSDAGLGWFDRRGHLRLVAPEIFIDADVPPAGRLTEKRPDGIRGKAGIAFAVASLLSPEKGPSIRGVAREAGLSAPSVSVAAASLRRAALIHDDGRPLLPDLFWALAEQWRPNFVHLGGDLTSTMAGQTDRLGVFGDASEPGWALTGTVAAYSYGAPLVAPSDQPPDFYLPDSRTLAVARRVFGEPTNEHYSCSIAVAPTPAACLPRRNLLSTSASQFAHFLFTRPLFVALELANDKARGQEILADWTPEDGSRVW